MPALLSQAKYQLWTPSLKDSSGVAVSLSNDSSHTAAGQYRIDGDECKGWFVIVLGTSVTFTNAGTFTVDLPVAPRVTPTAVYPTAIAAYPAGSGYINDASSEAGIGEQAHYSVEWAVQLSSSRLIGVLDWRVSGTGSASYVGSAEPFTFAISDKIAGRFAYPIA